MNCSKTTKYDENGNLVQETNLSHPKYAVAKRNCFNEKTDQVSSSRKNK